MAPEPILKTDGSKKNDCERSAAKRLLQSTRREHPHLKLTVIEDGLASNGPHIRELQDLGMHYILGVKPDDHKFLFEWVADSKKTTYERIDKNGVCHQFIYVNKVPLNDTNFDLKVNFLSYREIGVDGKTQTFSWVTDFEITNGNVFQIMRGARARWKIENETFNTLKTQGYNFEHNYGHGQENLFAILSLLMMLSFLIDQVQMLVSPLFREAKKAAGSWSRLWEDMRGLLKWVVLESWEQLFEYIVHQEEGPPFKMSG